MNLEKLKSSHIDDMLKLQSQCINEGANFTPTSRDGYLRAFQYSNFCYGIWCSQEGRLVAFCNCSIPTSRAKRNLGINRVSEDKLDSVGHVNTILVDKNHRGKKYGKMLVEKSLIEFQRKGITYIYVTISLDNFISINLFKSFGFKVIDEIEVNGTGKYVLQL